MSSEGTPQHGHERRPTTAKEHRDASEDRHWIILFKYRVTGPGIFSSIQARVALLKLQASRPLPAHGRRN